MGVVYKLKPEIIEFILEKKKANFNLSCRAIAKFIMDEFQVEVSKSSINAVIKSAGLSMPVGRRSVKKRRRLGRGLLTQALPGAEPKLALPEPVPPAPAPAIPMPPPEAEEKPKEMIIMPAQKEEEPLPQEKPAQEAEELPVSVYRSFTGMAFLEAADYLIGGSFRIAEALNKRLGASANDIAAAIRNAIYSSLEENAAEDPVLAGLRGKIDAAPELLRILSGLAKEARYLRIDLDGGKSAWLDAHLHTVFPTHYIPDSFGLPLASLRQNINRCFGQGAPFIILKAPGDGVPPAELFALLAGLKKAKDNIRGVVALNSQLREIESFPLPAKDELPFIFGLWPWQFSEYRRMKGLGEFRPFELPGEGSVFHIADVRMEIIGPSSGEPFILRGAAVKFASHDKVRMVILSNLSPEAASFEEIAGLYFNSWPDPEGALFDLNRKMESFSYGPTMPETFWVNELSFNENVKLDITILLKHYFRALDAYFRQFFLSEECPNKDFFNINDNFYKLAVTSSDKEGYTILNLEIPPAYTFRTELAYACSRLNECQIRLPTGKRLWFKSP